MPLTAGVPARPMVNWQPLNRYNVCTPDVSFKNVSCGVYWGEDFSASNLKYGYLHLNMYVHECSSAKRYTMGYNRFRGKFRKIHVPPQTCTLGNTILKESGTVIFVGFTRPGKKIWVNNIIS